MNKENYKLYTWYPLTDNEYWVDFGDYPDFENCQTLVLNTVDDDCAQSIMTSKHWVPGWSIMAKRGTWKFMIIEKPKND